MRIALLSCFLLAVAGMCAAQDTNFAVGPQYLLPSDKTMFAHPIATPSLALDNGLSAAPSLPAVEPVVGDQSYVANPEFRHQADLQPIYYGYQRIPVVELTSTEPTIELPESIVNPGVVRMVDAASLSDSGFGVPLGESAAYSKTHKPHATRVFTNADIARLHGG